MPGKYRWPQRMRQNIQVAARRLLDSINAPRGAVNTLAIDRNKSSVIRVLVDPKYMSRLGAVPSRFAGYKVEVEERPPTSSYVSQLA